MAFYKHVHYVHQPVNVNKVHRDKQQSWNAKIAVAITRGFGTMCMFYILIAWMFAWMILAGLGFWLFALDRYPFPFLLFLSNLVQLWALPVLAVGQNVLGKHAELMAEEQFNTTKKSYHDIEQIMLHLDAQDEKILAILKKLEDRI